MSTSRRQSTGEFSVAGGYSTADGFIAEVSVAERNLLGRGLYAKASRAIRPVCARRSSCRSSSPISSAIGSRSASTLFAKQQSSTQLRLLLDADDRRRDPARLRAARGSRPAGALFALPADDLAAEPVDELQQHQSGLHHHLPDANAVGRRRRSLRRQAMRGHRPTAIADGEASLAVQAASSRRAPCSPRWSATRLRYNTLDNNKNPTSGMLAELQAGLRRRRRRRELHPHHRAMLRTYYEVMPDIIGVLHLQGGTSPAGAASDLRMLDHFQMGPNLVRGFAPAGIGPRDLTQFAYTGVQATRSAARMYWGASARSCRRRSTSCRRIPASGSRPSPMPARCGTTSARPSFPADRRSALGLDSAMIAAVSGRQRACMSAPRSASA